MQCGLPDVEALLGHLDRAPEAWRAATRSACEALHAAILEASPPQPASTQMKFMKQLP